MLITASVAGIVNMTMMMTIMKGLVIVVGRKRAILKAIQSRSAAIANIVRIAAGGVMAPPG
jgi:hypothetical protein